jgi:hypothetical protein
MTKYHSNIDAYKQGAMLGGAALFDSGGSGNDQS